MNLRKTIQRLRVIALLLFIFPTLAMVGSLTIHNTLISFKFFPTLKYSYIADIIGEEYIVNCTEDNGYCIGNGMEYLTEVADKIDDCPLNYVSQVFLVNGKKYKSKVEGALPTTLFYLIETSPDAKWALKEEFINNKIELKTYVTNLSNLDCIRNDRTYYFLYKYFPPFSYLINEKTKGIKLGSSIKVNPFLYGEVSISNLVKRHPINIFFKLFLYIGVILMIAYWYSYNSIFKTTINKKINIFYLFGLGSAICLFLHVYYLGTESNNEIIKDLKRAVLLLFLFFEIVAQTLLAFNIYRNKDVLSKYFHSSVVLMKLFFVSFIVFFTVIIIAILSVDNLPKKNFNIFEWNYFILLLIFYLLSSFMWKKKINS